jgi:hypothetical protein
VVSARTSPGLRHSCHSLTVCNDPHADKHAVIGQPIQQALRKRLQHAVDEDALEAADRRRHGKAVCPDHGGIRALEPGDPGLRRDRQALKPLQPHHFLGNLREDRRRIAGPGADLENALRRTDREGLDHARNEPGFVEGLAAADRQRQIARCQVAIAIRHEVAAGYQLERAQHRQIANARARIRR